MEDKPKLSKKEMKKLKKKVGNFENEINWENNFYSSLVL